jgi:4-hydroxybenzoate polyprenyltransferase
MAASYGLEVFYQLRKRNQALPLAQLAGRIDFALFPVAGYLCIGSPDMTALLYFLFFYPFAEAHLAVNDMIDVNNDRARGMETVTTLYGMGGSVAWISGFLAIHLVMALLFMTVLGWIARAGITAGLLLLASALAVLSRRPDPDSGMKALPLFHGVMLLYSVSIILDSVL